MRIGVVDAYANRKPRREVYPVQCALDVGQTVSEPSVLRENSVADALHVAFETTIGVAHEINVHLRPDGDVLELGLTVVGDDVPGARIDEGEYRRTGMSISAYGEIQTRDISVERSDNACALKIKPGAIDLGNPCGSLRFGSFDAIDGMNSLAELRLGLSSLGAGLLVVKRGLRQLRLRLQECGLRLVVAALGRHGQRCWPDPPAQL